MGAFRGLVQLVASDWLIVWSRSDIADDSGGCAAALGVRWEPMRNFAICMCPRRTHVHDFFGVAVARGIVTPSLSDTISHMRRTGGTLLELQPLRCCLLPTSFDVGVTHVVVLDSAGSVYTTMTAWLQADLARMLAATPPVRWLVAVVHHAPYSKGSEDSDIHIDQLYVRSRLLPLLEAAGLDLLLSGHSHSYERSLLIKDHVDESSTWNATKHLVDGGLGDPDTPDGPYVKPPGLTPYAGFVAVVVGSSGKVQNGTGFNYPAHRQFEDGKRALVECGSLLLDVVGGTLDGRFVNENGTVRDHFQIKKRAK